MKDKIKGGVKMKKYFETAIGFVKENKGTLIKATGVAVIGGAILGALNHFGSEAEYEYLEVEQEPEVESEESDSAE